MAEVPKKGILSKLFGVKNACCCNVTIEEVTDEPATVPEGKSSNASNAAVEERSQTSADKRGNRRSSSCCG
jgi:predicted secreted protein